MSQTEAFEIAVKQSKELTRRPDNETLLQLYSLYKQATEGDIPDDAPAPAMFDFVNKAKQDAWKALKGTTTDAAMDQYVALVEKLKSL